MRVLIVCSYKENLPHNMAPFIWEQTKALSEQGVEIKYFLVKGNGIKGYLKSFPKLKSVIRNFHPNLVHAHFGLCGLLANLQRKVPVITTYHGSDINIPKICLLSKFAIRLSAHNIFVSQKLVHIAKPKKKYSVIPCGINLEDYPIIDKLEARREMGLDLKKKYILFAGALDNPVKNPQLALEAICYLPEVELLELKGYSRPQVALLMNAVDGFLLTSHTEGSPQVIKEAMACGCPIVSVDVGDVAETISHTEGCFISSKDTQSLVLCIKKAIEFDTKTEGRSHIINLGYINNHVANELMSIYKRVMSLS